MKTGRVRGITPPVITPMSNDAEQSVSYMKLGNQVNRLLAGGARGTFPVGTNGEAYALSLAEREGILATVIGEARGRVPVYVGMGCITTANTIRLSKRTEELGADASPIVISSFALVSQKELYDYYATAIKEMHIPVILYNIPTRTGNKLLPETVQTLRRDIDVVAGAKDSSGDLKNLRACIHSIKELSRGVAILAGNDGAILTYFKEGGAGSIVGRANIWLKILTSIYDKRIVGGVAGTEQAQEIVSALQSIFRYGSPNTIIKAAIELLGYPVGRYCASFSCVPKERIETLQELLNRSRAPGPT